VLEPVTGQDLNDDAKRVGCSALPSDSMHLTSDKSRTNAPACAYESPLPLYSTSNPATLDYRMNALTAGVLRVQPIATMAPTAQCSSAGVVR
jgi:hypothetical protein